jgi:hypothetical protein
MVAEVTQEFAEDGGYDFLYNGKIVGRLVWISDVCHEHPRRGWWLTIPGQPNKLIYRVPEELYGDLPTARARGVSMSLGLAQHMLTDRVEGLLGPFEA